jgi:hypothetical protein
MQWLAYSYTDINTPLVRGEKQAIAKYLRQHPGTYAVSPEGDIYAYVKGEFELQKVPRGEETSTAKHGESSS